MKTIYALYLAVLFAVLATIGITPWLALHGPKDIAGFFYNAYVPTCHQWIYRSDCIFFDGQSNWIGDCIPHGKESQATIATDFTDAPKKWDGQFNYSRDQIGINRAERVQYGNTVGYKFPNDTRNIGIYLFMLLAGIALPIAWKRPVMPNFAYFVLGILPLAIDGTWQMLGYWESNSLVRFVTGALTGITLSVVVYCLLYETRKREKSEVK